MRRIRFGFTLIEVMIVIAVFSIGVLAVLRMVTYNIFTADMIRLKTTASFLAKESMSLAFNLRDSNRLSALEWDCVPNEKYNGTSNLEVCRDSLISGQQSTVAWMFGVSPNAFVDIRKIHLTSNFDENFNQAKLSLFSGNSGFPVMYYGTGDVESSGYFARYVIFTGLVESGAQIPRDELVKVESHVLYKKGGMTGEVVLESFIGNY